jgi:hypothetical protein
MYRTVAFALAVALSAAIAVAAPSTSHTATRATCDRYASPSGNDSAAGTHAAPYQTVPRLTASLAGGGTGCLLGGVYRGNVIISAGGTATRPLTLTQAGADRATVKGIVQIDDAANYVTVDGLRLDGTDPPLNNATQVMIFGDHVMLSNNEIFNGGQRICVSTGDANGNYGIAWYPSIVGNRIHDCGNKLTGSPTYPSGHALYLEADRYAHVADNVIYDTNYGGTTGGRGIQLWPDSENATIENNLVDNANQWSIIISGGSGYPTGATHDALVRNNIFTNPVQNNVTSAWWGLDPQPGNIVTGNCVFGAPNGDFDFQTWLGKFSYAVANNLHADPLYVNRPGKDFRLASGSPCAGKGPASIQPGAAASSSTPPTAPSAPTPPAPSASSAGASTHAAPATPAGSPSAATASASPKSPSTAAAARSAKRLSVSLVYRHHLHGRVRPAGGARSLASAVGRVEITRYSAGAWRHYAYVGVARDGRFVLRRNLWTSARRIVFRAHVLVGTQTVASKRLVLRRLRAHSAFAVSR